MTTYSSGPLPLPTPPKERPAEQPGAGHNSGVAQMLDEARALADDPRVVKSESGRILTTFLVRLCETLAHGGAETQHPPRHHE